MPHNRRDYHQQTLDAIDFIRSNPVASADTTIALSRHLAHQSEAAMTRADIESIERQDIRHHYAGKQAPRANRKKLTAVIDGKGLMKLESEQQEKETGGVARGATKGKKGKETKESIKQKAHTPFSSSEFC